MTTDITVLAEPTLEFRFGQKLSDPRSGLSLFGAVDIDSAAWPGQIPYAVVGTAAGIATMRRFAECITNPVVSEAYSDPEGDVSSKLLWPPFPGFSAAFGAPWPSSPAWSRSLDESKLMRAARHNDKYRRAYDTANFYLDAIRMASERDENFGLVICVIPDEIWLNCRPHSRVVGGEGVAKSKKERVELRNQANLFEPYLPEEYDMSVDFRRQLKARAMEYRLPLQLVRESTLIPRDSKFDDSRGLTPLSDRAWNLSTAFYYKAGGKPWRLSSAREGVCYIGTAFRRSEVDDDPRTACCAAQMFLDTGDGVVFQGKFGPWYSEVDDACHLTDDAAEHLLKGVLHEYETLDGRPLKEIFLHSRSSIGAREWEGYRRACPEGVRLVGVRVRREHDGLRLYRAGDWPVMRGTVWRIGENTAYLWASGFKPTVLSYDGWEVPVPLRLDIEHGEADIGRVATDILGLTKLNYNACKLGDASPVTVGFSDQVGEILIGNPTIKVRLPSFRYYI